MNLADNEIINNLFQQIGFLPVLLILYLVTMTFFWYESMRVNKNRNAILDQWFFTTIAMIFWGRLMYLLTNWSSFVGGYWFWLPYEKYGDEIYFLRAMPWRILQIWDGGFLFIPMYFAFLVINYMYVVMFKKWRWKEMMYAVVASANLMLGGTLFVFGYFIQSGDIINYGIYLLAFFMVFWSIRAVVKGVYRNMKYKMEAVLDFFAAIYLMLTTGLIGYIFLSQDITGIDKAHVYLTIFFSLFMLVMFILDVRRGEVAPPEVDLSYTRDRTITLNQSIKIKPR